MILWLQFFLCTAVIFFAGSRLSKYGDILAEKTGLGGAWIGVVLMATVTSLPELVTGISSVAWYGLADIAAGDAIGSCMFNMFILALLDIGGSSPISSRAHTGHVLSASFGILLMGISVLGISAGSGVPALGWIGPYTLATLCIYFVAMRMIFTYEKKRVSEFVKELAEEAKYQSISMKRAGTLYTLNALLVVGAATYLPGLGGQIAEITGLGQTFVGNIFIAFATSLPEVVVTAAALRIGAVDMGVGNLFGSNLFNMAILALDDLFFSSGPILESVNRAHGFSALSAILMTSIAIIGLTYRSEKKKFFFSWDSLGIFMVYFLTIVILYQMR